MNFRHACWFASVGLALALAAASRAEPGRDSLPDPRQIPLPSLVGDKRALPSPSELPIQKELPPVLAKKGPGALTPAEWPARRAEMQRIIEDHFTGRAPPPPGNVSGTVLETRKLAGGRVKYRRVALTFGPTSKPRLSIGIFTPAGKGSFPALIDPAGTPPGASPLPRLPMGPGQGQGADALLRVGPDSPPRAPAKAAPLDAEAIARTHPALARGYAYVVFDHNDCGEDTTLRNADGSWAFRGTRFFPQYPGYDWGLLRAWAWGVSRIIDYLETDTEIDAASLIVTGFSRTGKAALIAGALDDRIAITAPAATGGGGVGAFRRSGPGRGGKEGLDLMLEKYPNWFGPGLYPFWGYTDRLPFDQHWLIALIAPRAFIALEGESDPVSLASAVRASWSGAAPAFALLGASDRLGVNYAPRAHAVTRDDHAALFDFADGVLGRSPPARRFDRFPPSAFESSEAASAPSPRVELWNGRDLSGWSLHLKDGPVEVKPPLPPGAPPPPPPTKITLSPTVLVSDVKGHVEIAGEVLRFVSPRMGYLKTDRAFSDYHLHVEWRWPKDAAADANSGVMLHINGPDVIWPSSFECQLKNNNAGQVVGMGLDIPAAPLLNLRKRAPRLASPSEQTLGEWNTYEIYAQGDRIEAFVNGVRQNEVTDLPVRAGRIALQLEGFPIEFRRVWLEPLQSSTSAAKSPAQPAAAAPPRR